MRSRHRARLRMKRGVRLAARAARPVAHTVRAARRRPRLTVLGWHRIDDSGTPLSTPVSVFERQLDVLARLGADVLPLDAAVHRLAAGNLPDLAVALTFDDGYASVLETAWPRLRQRDLPATLFGVAGYFDGGRRFPWDRTGGEVESSRLATADEIRAAARDGLDVGSHTLSHRWLPWLSEDELAHELRASRAALEDVLGRRVGSIAYPMGGWDARVRDAAGDAGYAIGITVDRGTNPQHQDQLALRRAFAPRTVPDFELLMAGAYTWLRPLDRLRTRNGPPW
jgi:peptidoglycan/xylan/chitin deacetylase (PgdA/CDA1 family)